VQVQLVITKQKRKEPRDLHFLLSQADVVQFEKKNAAFVLSLRFYGCDIKFLPNCVV
jgi:hypothetical protein